MFDESGIQRALGEKLCLKNICIPNLTMYNPNEREYEADFIYFNLNKDFLTEVEIKINIEDFRNDFKKHRFHDDKHVKYLYYAFPRYLYGAFKDEIEEKCKSVGAGVISITGTATVRMENPSSYLVTYEKKAKARSRYTPLTDMDKLKIMRIGCMKWVKR